MVAPPDTVLDGRALREAVRCFGDLLQTHREAINRLNVYPVPDGDTGTNMTLTVQSVIAEVGTAEAMADVCAAIAHGSLMGARGNSGVILSQILRGLTDVLKSSAAADGATFAAALDAAAVAAYKAVQRPVEGTILTVVREAAAAGVQAAEANADLVEVIHAALVQGDDALARTPELLAVLAQAGVVDAGGKGLLLLFHAFLVVLDGRTPPEPDVAAPAMAPVRAQAAPSELADLRYEVMFLLDAPDDRIDGFRQAWAACGDSIVVVGGDGLYNCHVHTDDIGACIEAGIAVGRPHKIRVTDLLDEVAEQGWVEAALGTADEDGPEVTTAVVAVATGDGIARIFRSLGVHRVVVGGQTMNPSTADLLEAVERVAADSVILLPNNKNIVAVAEQVDGESAKSVRVVPTTCVPEGFAALLSYDPEGDVDENAASMTAAISGVVAGEVTLAVRDSASEAGPITAGDAIGLTRGKVCVVRSTVGDALVALLDELVGDDHELVTLIVGEEADPHDTEVAHAWLNEHRPDAEVEIHAGGQPLYPFYIGVE